MSRHPVFANDCPECKVRHPNGWACPKAYATLEAKNQELEDGGYPAWAYSEGTCSCKRIPCICDDPMPPINEMYEGLEAARDSWRRVSERLESEKVELERRLGEALAIDEAWTGCGTGDCPHATAQECADALVTVNVATIRESEGLRTQLTDLDREVEGLREATETFLDVTSCYVIDRRPFDALRRKLATLTTHAEKGDTNAPQG